MKVDGESRGRNVIPKNFTVIFLNDFYNKHIRLEKHPKRIVY
jgi:hypothetical protein